MCGIHAGTANVGRPLQFDPTDEEVELIEKLAAVLTQEQTADFLGVQPTTFQRAIERDDRISGAYTRGRAKAIAAMGNSVFRAGIAGDANAAKFYLATQAGWSVKSEMDLTSKGEQIGQLPDFTGLSAQDLAALQRQRLGGEPG